MIATMMISAIAHIALLPVVFSSVIFFTSFSPYIWK